MEMVIVSIMSTRVRGEAWDESLRLVVASARHVLDMENHNQWQKIRTSDLRDSLRGRIMVNAREKRGKAWL